MIGHTARGARTGAGMALVGLLTLLPAPAAVASPDFAMGVDVDNAQIIMSGGTGGSCEWQVSSSVTVVNITSQPIALSAVEANADFTGTGFNGHVPATILSSAGLDVGVTLAANEIRTFAPVTTRFTIPCDSDYGQVEYLLTSPAGRGAGDSPFLQNGTAVPFLTVAGAVGATVLMAGLFLARQRRRAEVQAVVGSVGSMS